MTKFCIFCGKPTNKKNKEHVIPKWLIKLTGNTKRNIQLGMVVGEGKIGNMTFAFNQFQFPSCTKCNSDHAYLESDATKVVVALLGSKPIETKQVSILLNWLDKVRIGLWLGYLYLNKNCFGIDPSFYIADRVWKSDRMVAIYRVDGDTDGINFSGVQTPTFQHQPSCFMLRINHLYFFNMSDSFLFSARLGFPYKVSRSTNTITMAKGAGFAKYPLIRKSLISPAIDFYQPIIPEGLLVTCRSLYDQDYVHKHSFDWARGIGAIFGQISGKIIQHKDPIDTGGLSNQGFQKNSKDYWKLLSQVYEFQNHLADRYDPGEIGDATKRSDFKKTRKHNKAINNLLIHKLMKKQVSCALKYKFLGA
ncbi:MAG: hypothetical protein HZC10_06290 [Nitrospirae bacterium]|nr:hypothetical protein [Nitrospirota bacterium]